MDAEAVAGALQRWLELRAYASYDPYDGLTSHVLRPLLRARLAARVAMQVVKRSPVNLRPLLGIRPAVYTKSLSDLASASFLRARLGDSGALERGLTALAQVRARALPVPVGVAWGMDLPYVSRFASATPGTPNLFQTVNAAAAFLDAQALDPNPAHLETALAVVAYLEHGLGRLEETPESVAWRYYPGQDACIYNVNALVGALLLRLAAVTGRSDLADLGRRTLRFIAASQNPDGSWFYARGPEGRWVDGFHTGYVLESLLTAARMHRDPVLEASLERGTRFYLETMFTPDHLPRYTADSTYPIEVQNCAQAVQTLSRLAGRDPALLPRARSTAQTVIDRLFRWERRGPDASGYFVLSRGRIFTNPLAAVRWGQAPMLLALAHLAAAEHGLTPP